MTSYVVRRVLWTAPVVVSITLVTFVLMHSVPGGPWDSSRPLSPQLREQLQAKYGLGEPLWRQFLTYSWNALHGDLGVSLQYQDRAVATVIRNGLEVSAILAALAFAVALVFGVGLGVLAATQHGKPIDRLLTGLTVGLGAAPSFVLGILLVIVFAVKLGWLPAIGWERSLWLFPEWRQAVLPVVTLAALPAAYLARITRAAVLDVLQQDYVRTAHAKGLRRWTIVTRHVLPNALVPVLSVAGPIAASLVTGSFIVETIFAIPGLGHQFVTSVFQRDYGMIMGLTIFYALVVTAANLAVDLLYAVVDPRIRY